MIDVDKVIQQTMYIIFALLTNFRILVEQHTFRGRTDITMETKDTIYVIELKFNKSAQEALDQINNKHYADAFALRGKNVEKIGMNFIKPRSLIFAFCYTKCKGYKQKRVWHHFMTHLFLMRYIILRIWHMWKSRILLFCLPLHPQITI